MLLIENSYTTHYAFKPRIVVPKHPSRDLEKNLFVPIKGNQMLLFAEYFEKINSESYLHLSIHEIRSNNRVSPALWSFNGSVDDHFDIDNLKPLKSTENALGITFGARFDNHWKLFDISTTDTDALDKFPLIESGRIDFDLKLNSRWEHDSFGLSNIFRQSC
jgi:hypothetical protein